MLIVSKALMFEVWASSDELSTFGFFKARMPTNIQSPLFPRAVRGMRKVGEPMEPGWTLHIHASKGELASCHLP